MKKHSGFTLIETIVAMGITLTLLAFFLANYGRSNKDSLLNREVAIVMANIRYAQELTSTGKTIKHCSFFQGKECTNNADCHLQYITSSGTLVYDDLCTDETSPPGGYAVVFSCTPPVVGGEHQYPSPNGDPTGPGDEVPFIPYYGKRAYSIFADNFACKNTDPPANSTESCFPLRVQAADPTKPWQGPYASDGVVSSMNMGSWPGLRGDTLKKMFFLNNDVEVREISTISFDGIVKTKCSEASKWSSYPDPALIPPYEFIPGVPNTNSSETPKFAKVYSKAAYPVQAVIRFIPPDGRKVQINDNVTSSPPTPYGHPLGQWKIYPNNPWAKAEIMLGIVKRNSDCRVVTVAQSGVISQRLDADCNLATPN